MCVVQQATWKCVMSRKIILRSELYGQYRLRSNKKIQEDFCDTLLRLNSIAYEHMSNASRHTRSNEQSKTSVGS